MGINLVYYYFVSFVYFVVGKDYGTTKYTKYTEKKQMGINLVYYYFVVGEV